MITPEKVRLLLVEDNPGDVMLIRELLSESTLDLEIEVACDGEDALNYLFRRGKHKAAPRPQLMVLDLNLPRVSGLEVLRTLRADPVISPLPVVVLSSSEAEKDISESYSRGANSYVSKPVDLRQFQQAVNVIEDFWLTLAKLPTLPQTCSSEDN